MSNLRTYTCTSNMSTHIRISRSYAERAIDTPMYPYSRVLAARYKLISIHCIRCNDMKIKLPRPRVYFCTWCGVTSGPSTDGTYIPADNNIILTIHITSDYDDYISRLLLLHR